MFQTLKKLIRLNLDDLFLYLGVEGGLFLLIQIIIGCVMHFGRPSDSVTVACILFPIVGGFTALVAGISHVGVSFEQALRFGQTRRRALGLTLGLMSFEAAFALVLAGLLAAVERFLCVPLWVRLSGMNVWVPGRSGVMEFAVSPGHDAPITGKVFENMSGELVPLPEKTLIVESFTLDWYWWLLIFVLAVVGGIIAGALLQRLGPKGGWVVWGVCMAPVFLTQIFPLEVVSAAEVLIPLLAVLLVIGLVWSVWSLLHAVVKG